MEQLHHFEEDYQHGGGTVTVLGFEHFEFLSHHPLAARKFSPGSQTKFEIRLSPRQIELRKFALAQEYVFNPMKVRSAMKYKDFPIEKGNNIQYEENFMEKYIEAGKISISDVTLTQGARQDSTDTHITVVHITETELSVPDFALEPEGLSTKLSEMFVGKDIDFPENPEFSKKYYLRGPSEVHVRDFFAGPIIHFLEKQEPVHIEAHKNRLLFYKKLNLLEAGQIQELEKVAEEFVMLALQKVKQPI